LVAEPLTGQDPGQIGGYRTQARLGLGAVGPLYTATAPDGRPVVVTLVRPEFGADPGFREQFAEDAAAALTIQSPYTAPVLGADPAGQHLWLAAAYVPGPSLQQAIAQYGPMPTGTALLLISSAAQALAAIHAAGLAHGDLRPSAVLLAQGGPQVTGFGFARALEAAALGRDALRARSLRYPAPEQIAGAPASAAGDVFALGHLAAYALLGRSPYGAFDQVSVSHRILHQEADLAGCPESVCDLIERCLAAQPADRPSPGEVAEFCGPLLAAQATMPLWPAPIPVPQRTMSQNTMSQNTMSLSPGPAARSRRSLSRPVVIGSGAGVVLLAAAVGVGVFVLKGSSPANDAASPAPSPVAHVSRSASPSPSPSPSSAIDPCLVGTWKGTADTVNNTIDGNSVTFTGPGPGSVVFKADGTNITSYGAGETLSATINGDHWTEVLKGASTQHIETRGGVMLSSNVVTKGTWVLKDNGSTNASGALALETAPAPYSCSGNTLREYDSAGGSQVFTRVSR
jgi:serine/threonine protein kinase